MKINLNTSELMRIASNDQIIKNLELKYEKLEREIKNFVTYANRYEFPSIGVNDSLYVAIDEAVIYYWVDDHYKALTGIDALQQQLTAIVGGGAN